MQGQDDGRPVMAFYYDDKPLPIAITVSDNGFIVSMNPQSKLVIQKSDLSQLKHWPPRGDSPQQS
jgi:hypothetical protein